VAPQGAVGTSCFATGTPTTFTDTTIGDLLNTANVPWAFYAGGYQAVKDANGGCPPIPDDCTAHLAFFPCSFTPGDYPNEYYPSLRDDPQSMRDGAQLEVDLANTTLPAVAFVKAVGYKSEHPGLRNKLSDGVAFASGIVDAVLASAYRADTLILLTYDEGGGYFDHVKPPDASAVDGKPYGTRVPMIAIGPFAKKNFVSHVVMEHSSIVKLIEWNWLGQTTGQLGGRDAVVANMGSLLDSQATGATIPEN
jgi:phospholipase C